MFYYCTRQSVRTLCIRTLKHYEESEYAVRLKNVGVRLLILRVEKGLNAWGRERFI